MIAVWADRAGIFSSIFDGRQWTPPQTVVGGGKAPRMSRTDKRLYLTALHSGALYFTERLPRG